VTLAEPDETGFVYATVFLFPEVHTFGTDRADAFRMLRDAVEVAIEARMLNRAAIPASDGESDRPHVVVNVPPPRRNARKRPHISLETEKGLVTVFPANTKELLRSALLEAILMRLGLTPEQFIEALKN